MASESLAEIAGLAVAHAPGGFSHAAAGLQVAQGQRHARAGVKVLRAAAPGLAEAAAQAAFAHVQLIGQVADGNAFMRVRQQPAAGLLHAGSFLRAQQAGALNLGRSGSQGRGAAGGQQTQLLMQQGQRASVQGQQSARRIWRWMDGLPGQGAGMGQGGGAGGAAGQQAHAAGMAQKLAGSGLAQVSGEQLFVQLQAQLLDVLLGAAAVAALALGVDEAGDGDAAAVKAKLLAAPLFKRRVALQPEGQAQQRARQAAAAFVLLSGLKAQCDCVGVLSVCPAARAL